MIYYSKKSAYPCKHDAACNFFERKNKVNSAFSREEKKIGNHSSIIFALNK